MYSSSANEHNKKFDEDFAYNKSDVVVYTNKNFEDSSSSNIYKVSNSKIKKIR